MIKQFNARLPEETHKQIDDIAEFVGDANTPPKKLSQAEVVTAAIDRWFKDLWKSGKKVDKSSKTA